MNEVFLSICDVGHERKEAKWNRKFAKLTLSQQESQNVLCYHS